MTTNMRFVSRQHSGSDTSAHYQVLNQGRTSDPEATSTPGAEGDVQHRTGLTCPSNWQSRLISMCQVMPAQRSCMELW